ncbi:MAG: urea ABC transporter permease subunit UrtB [Lachnospiraceae bacterium]|nr:urea ABC transporter permease subunit UrtB [Lachnospiraceae bacterium]
MLETLISLFINGLNSAALLILTCLGLVVIIGLMDVFNMATGEFIMLGAYITYISSTVLGLPFLVSLVLSFVVTVLVGIVFERLLLSPLRKKRGDGLLLTYGLSIVLQQVITIIYGPEMRYVSVPFKGNIEIGNLLISYYNLFTIFVAIVTFAVTFIIFFKTKLGMQIRATTQNRAMTECLGIKTPMLDTFTFAFGCGITGICGCILAPVRTVHPLMGASYLTDALMSVVVGGVNNILGTVVASLGISESLVMFGGFFNEVNVKILVFITIIVILRFKPDGLFAKKGR